jgi:hypothetical protein
VALLLMAECAKHLGPNDSISGLQRVSIAWSLGSFWRVLMLMIVLLFHDDLTASLVVYFSCDLTAVDPVDSVRE